MEAGAGIRLIQSPKAEDEIYLETTISYFQIQKTPTTFSVVGDFFAFGIEAKGFRFDRLIAYGKAAGRVPVPTSPGWATLAP